MKKKLSASEVRAIEILRRGSGRIAKSDRDFSKRPPFSGDWDDFGKRWKMSAAEYASELGGLPPKGMSAAKAELRDSQRLRLALREGKRPGLKGGPLYEKERHEEEMRRRREEEEKKKRKKKPSTSRGAGRREK